MRPDTAVVLSGGGSRGAFQVGVLQELLKSVSPDVIIGTSVGALNGLFVCDHGNADGLEHIWSKLTHSFAFPINHSIFYRFSRANALYKNKNLRRLISQYSEARDFEDLKIPLYVNSTRLTDGRSVFFSKGPLLDPVLASCAVVPFYPPQIIDGLPYIDGGFSEFGGLSKAFDLKAKRVILVDSGSVCDDSFDGVIDVTRHSLELVTRASLVHDIERFRKKVVLIAPKSLGNVHITDFSKSKEFMAEGILRCREALRQI
ncbi:TPA: patatin-like phospholipase family protein [Candidatus Woesearchaeota archaeon]|nr:patatin-like phospholipase family protein [Candidatus Woesearchaeota archaeon]